MAIEAVGAAIGTIGGSAPSATPSAGVGDGLLKSFDTLLDSASRADSAADQAVGRMIDGTGDVPEAMIALQQADLALQFTVQVRNKLVQAYQDIMRMPI